MLQATLIIFDTVVDVDAEDAEGTVFEVFEPNCVTVFRLVLL